MGIKRRLSGAFAAATIGVFTTAAYATNLLALSHDEETDTLVLEVAYRGSHGEHPFSLDWGECKDYAFGPPHQIGAQLIDHDFNDSGPNEFKQTLKFSLAGLECRPAKLTIRTSSGAYRTILLPVADEAVSKSRDAESGSEDTGSQSQ